MNDDELTPTTGVYNGNDLAWENMPDDGIDLDYEEAYAARRQELIDGIMTLDDEPELYDDEIETVIAPDLEAEFEFYESSGGTVLYGDWVRDEDGLYGPGSENPNAKFALIYNQNENTAQVVWSRFVRYGKPASLCYPGQVDAETDDPTEPEGPVGTVTIGSQFVATERRYVPYYALPEYALRGGE